MADRVSQKQRVTKLIDRGLVQYALGRRDAAISLWREALEQAPRNLRVIDYLESVGAIPAGSLAQPDMVAAQVEQGREPAALNGRADHSMVPPFTAEVAAYDDGALDSDEMDMEPVVPDVELLLGEARKAEAEGRLDAALKSAEDAFRREPEDEQIGAFVVSVKNRLREQYLQELEPLDRVPYLRATDASILELSLDPIGGFLISQIDGEITTEELLTILGTFDEFRVLSSLHFFLESGIIELR